MKPADGNVLGDQRMGADLAHVLAQRRLLVLDDVEDLPRRVLPGRLAHPVTQLDLGVGGDGAAGMRDDQHPVDAEQVHPENDRLQGGVGDAAAGVAEDLGVTRRQADHPQRVDPGVHAGHHRDARVGDPVEPLQGEVLGECPVRGEQVVEGVALGCHRFGLLGIVVAIDVVTDGKGWSRSSSTMEAWKSSTTNLRRFQSFPLWYSSPSTWWMQPGRGR